MSRVVRMAAAGLALVLLASGWVGARPAGAAEDDQVGAVAWHKVEIFFTPYGDYAWGCDKDARVFGDWSNNCWGQISYRLDDAPNVVSAGHFNYSQPYGPGRMDIELTGDTLGVRGWIPNSASPDLHVESSGVHGLGTFLPTGDGQAGTQGGPLYLDVEGKEHTSVYTAYAHGYLGMPAPDPAPASWSCNPFPVAVVGQPVNIGCSASGYPVPTIALAGALPPSLELHVVGGMATITGVAQKADTTAVALTAYNSSGPPAVTILTIRVVDDDRPPPSDVPGDHPSGEAIRWVLDHDVAHGFSDGSFRPDAVVTRQAMAAFLHRLDQLGCWAPLLPEGQDLPSDVPADHPFADDIAWLLGEGISQGFSDGSFRPEAPITRQAVASMLLRLSQALGLPVFEPDGVPSFFDVPLDHPFDPAITWMAMMGISHGFSDGSFRPDAPVKRQVAATFLERFATLGCATSPSTSS